MSTTSDSSSDYDDEVSIHDIIDHMTDVEAPQVATPMGPSVLTDTIIHVYGQDNNHYSFTGSIILTYPEMYQTETERASYLLRTISNTTKYGAMVNANGQLTFINSRAILRMTFTGYVPEGIQAGALHF